MKTTKVIFRYSWIYDQQQKGFYEDRVKLGYTRNMPEKYPTSEEIKEYIEKVKNIWIDLEEKILQEFCHITGFEWQNDTTICYVVGYSIPFSDPLTVPMYKEYPDWFIDNLTHELLHRFLHENYNQHNLQKYWSFVDEKYADLSELARYHLIIHAIHTAIYLKFFDQQRVNRNIEMMSGAKEYKISWDKVKEEGYEKIIRDFRENLGEGFTSK